MTEYSLLERTLAENLSWNRARIKFLAAFLLALFAAKTVNLALDAPRFLSDERQPTQTINESSGFCVFSRLQRRKWHA